MNTWRKLFKEMESMEEICRKFRKGRTDEGQLKLFVLEWQSQLAGSKTSYVVWTRGCGADQKTGGGFGSCRIEDTLHGENRSQNFNGSDEDGLVEMSIVEG